MIENYSVKLSERKNISEGRISKLKLKLEQSEHISNQDLLIFIAGSIARGEYGKKSDMDIFLIHRTKSEQSYARTYEINVLAEIIRINRELGYPDIDGDARYLKIYNSEQLINKTGNPLDDNENYFTTRMLLLLESKAVFNVHLYEDIINDVLSHYMRDDSGDGDFLHFFILNDILRYWRTICLNYENRRNDKDKPWRKKNINIKFGRMLTVFATVLWIVARNSITKNDLLTITKSTPVERLIMGVEILGDTNLINRLPNVLDIYNEYIKMKETEEGDLKLEQLQSDIDSKSEIFSSYIYDCLTCNLISDRYKRFLLI